jgi:hypothetical protein
MTERYDLLTVRESNGKSYFTKLGAMFPNQKGDGFNIVLDGVPASVDGQYRLLAKVPLPRDNDRQQSRGPANSSATDADDDFPAF